MTYRLFSFLGPTRYLEAYYKYNDKMSQQACQFIQEAFLELFCNQWGRGDEIIILLTEESRRKNWLNKNECEDANFDYGLRERLEVAKERLGLDIEVKEVIIPEGKSEYELWEIFEIINCNVNKDDIIIFDITHSFRYLPMLTLIALNYVRFIKNVKIDKVVYGALEALGNQNEVKQIPLERRIIPVFDLTSFVMLFDWTSAIERFLETGNAAMIEKLGIDAIKPLLTQSKGKVGRNIRNLIKSLNRFSKNVLTCRLPDISSNINLILKSLDKAEKELNHINVSPLKPFIPLFAKIKEKFKNIQTNDQLALSAELIYWCLEKDLIQQGFTILRESLVNYVIIRILNSYDLKSSGNRKRAEDMLNERNGKIPEYLLNLWHEIVDYRNDINHAGWRENNYHKCYQFREKLKEFLERFKSFIDK